MSQKYLVLSSMNSVESVLLTLFTINTLVTCMQMKEFFMLKLFELINLNGSR